MNGHPGDRGLLDALVHYGLDHMGHHEKNEMRQLILAGGPWGTDDWNRILDYCESDTAALARLLPVMLPQIDLPRAVLRGRFMAAAAHIERNGVPIDIDSLRGTAAAVVNVAATNQRTVGRISWSVIHGEVRSRCAATICWIAATISAGSAALRH